MMLRPYEVQACGPLTIDCLVTIWQITTPAFVKVSSVLVLQRTSVVEESGTIKTAPCRC